MYDVEALHQFVPSPLRALEMLKKLFRARRQVLVLYNVKKACPGTVPMQLSGGRAWEREFLGERREAGPHFPDPG